MASKKKDERGPSVELDHDDPKLKELTDLEKRYVYHYKLLKNKTKAYKAAGGKSIKNARQSAWIIHNQPHVKAAVEEEEVKLDEKMEELENGLSSEAILEDLKKVYEQAMRGGRFADALKAKELMGKHIGMFKDKRSEENRARKILISDYDDTEATLTETQETLLGLLDKLIEGVDWNIDEENTQ